MSMTTFLRALRGFARAWLKWPFYILYEKRLLAKSRDWRLPEHIGIVLDGNRRWARDQGMCNVVQGHARGADHLHDVLDWCFQLNIRVVTVWVFSTENFRRDGDEVGALLDLIEQRTRSLVDNAQLHENQVRVRYIGRLNLLPESLQEAIAQAQEATADYDRFMLNVAIAYGGRQEITDAFRDYVADLCRRGEPMPEALDDMDPDALKPYLYTADMPDPDLLIRTSGEVRLSGFLLWQSAYSEYYFCDTFWPEFRHIDFLRALRSYDRRHRRHGR